MYAHLLQPLDILPGVGAKLAGRLRARGLDCLGDLLLHLPRDYVDDREVVAVSELAPGSAARVRGTVVSRRREGAGRRQRVIVSVADAAGDLLDLLFFHSPFLMRDARLCEGGEITARGVPEVRGHRLQMIHPDWRAAADHRSGWQPRYPGVAGLTGRRVAGLAERALERLPADAASPLDERLPDLPTFAAALHLMHRPPAEGPFGERMAKARRRLQLEELLLYLHLMREKRARAAVVAPAMTREARCAALLDALPYPLTDAQRQAWREIGDDLASGRRMHRLLQGDVGAGKTWVAALATVRAVENGFQAAFMAPTEVLAEQHAASLRELLAPLGIEVALLTGGTRAAERRATVAGLADGGIAAVVGTHALISDEVSYARLGLAIVDEQHRFGVAQRWALAERGEAVHLLAMTATPIPRSLALSLYGDMDLSLMRGMPPGRKPVITRVLSAGSRGALADGIERLLAGEGRIYWIVPRIEEEEGASVEQRAEALARRFPDAGVRGLHGRLKSAEKQEILGDFAAGRCRLLVSTTVVEVGVNVPEARLIVVEEAERYGLAQLHQLRGRVGRSSEQGYCILLPGSEAGQTSLSRLRQMSRTHDGLELAEIDMELRGAGDALGARQSGEAGFRLLDPASDAALIRDWHARLPEFEPGAAMTRFWRPFAEAAD